MESLGYMFLLLLEYYYSFVIIIKCYLCRTLFRVGQLVILFERCYLTIWSCKPYFKEFYLFGFVFPDNIVRIFVISLLSLIKLLLIIALENGIAITTLYYDIGSVLLILIRGKGHRVLHVVVAYWTRPNWE